MSWKEDPRWAKVTVDNKKDDAAIPNSSSRLTIGLCFLDFFEVSEADHRHGYVLRSLEILPEILIDKRPLL